MTGTTGVNTAINVIQISALLVFSVIALAYRFQHKDGDVGWHLSNGTAVTYQVDTTNVLYDKGKPVQDTWRMTPLRPKWVSRQRTPRFRSLTKKTRRRTKTASRSPPTSAAGSRRDRRRYEEQGPCRCRKTLRWAIPTRFCKRSGTGKLTLKDGKAIAVPFTISYKAADAVTGAGTDKDPTTFNFHQTALSVIAPHSLNFVFIQACIAILILVGFESVTAMGEEAKNAKRDVPRAVLLSLVVQGAFCHRAIEYFAANYLLHNGYTLSNAVGSGRCLYYMMAGFAASWLFGSYSAGRAFMPVQRLHGVSGAHRDDAVLLEHRCSRDLRDGPRR